MSIKKVTEKDKKIYRSIKSLMVLCGINQRIIAKKLGVSHAAVSQVISGKISSERIKREIARSLGKGVGDLWPGE